MQQDDKKPKAIIFDTDPPHIPVIHVGIDVEKCIGMLPLIESTMKQPAPQVIVLDDSKDHATLKNVFANPPLMITNPSADTPKVKLSRRERRKAERDSNKKRKNK